MRAVPLRAAAQSGVAAGPPRRGPRRFMAPKGAADRAAKPGAQGATAPLRPALPDQFDTGRIPILPLVGRRRETRPRVGRKTWPFRGESLIHNGLTCENSNLCQPRERLLQAKSGDFSNAAPRIRHAAYRRCHDHIPLTYHGP